VTAKPLPIGLQIIGKHFGILYRPDERRAGAPNRALELAFQSGKHEVAFYRDIVAAVPPGTRIVLPSPNGSTLSLAAASVTTVAGCLRNATTVGHEAQRLGRRITVIAAGERWPDGQLRPALEDLLGGGAVVSALAGRRSPEAEMAQRVFESTFSRLRDALLGCASGRQLVEMGFADDVDIAAVWDVSRCAPVLMDGAFHHSTP
jgi:2-phosphosulfolactate phosphatase